MMDVHRPIERRSGDRRKTNFGPPAGCEERRVNIERRVFDFPFDATPKAASEANRLER